MRRRGDGTEVWDEEMQAGERTQLGENKKKEEKKGNVRSQEVCKNVTGEREEEEEVGCAGECDSSMPGGQLFELGTLLSLKHEKITPQLEPNLQEMSERPFRICLEEVEKKKLIKRPDPFVPFYARWRTLRSKISAGARL